MRTLTNSNQSPNLIVVGAGFYGSTIAHLAANEGFNVKIIESRPHVGGNAYSYFDEDTGIEVHKYGSHLFHTSNERIWKFVNQFGAFNNYVHTVWAMHQGNTYSLPINLATINHFFGQSFSPAEAHELLSEHAEKHEGPPANLEQKAISSIGKPLYEAFVKGYTEKQWQTSALDLPPEVIARLPVRFSFNNRYFSDTWEGLPIDGYTSIFERMLDSDKIEISLNTDYLDLEKNHFGNVPVVYTGALDRYFDYSLGMLNWRTLDFDFETIPVSDYQGTSVMNFSDMDVPYTRIHEFRHLHPERRYTQDATVIAKEFSRFAGRSDEPYYPVNSSKDRELLAQYRELAQREENVFFGGRLGTYKYLDMHMAIGSALSDWTNKIQPHLNQTSLN